MCHMRAQEQTATDRAMASALPARSETARDPRFRAFRATGSRADRNELVEEFYGLAEQCARRFSDRGEPLEDLVQVALVGLVKAVEWFDPDRGVSFEGFAIPTITGEIKRHFRDHTWDVSVPRRAKELMARLRGTNDLLEQRLGRRPTIAELGDELNVSVETVIETMEASTVYRSLSTDRSWHNAGAGGSPTYLPKSRIT